MLHWTLRLHCSNCQADIVYQDERPPWQIEPPDPDLIEQAERWIAEHPRSDLLASRPPFVTTSEWWGGETLLAVPEPLHYVACPACDGRAYRGSAVIEQPLARISGKTEGTACAIPSAD